jgi:molecular chaperone DnaK
VKRTEDITLNMVQDHAVSVRGEAARQKLSSVRPGWQAIDAVLVTGGASRMPMIRNMLKRISGTTLNTALSPDQSICHGAAYYAGMLLSNQQFAKSVLASDVAARLALVRQQSVNARALGVLVTDRQTGARQPHYILPANTPLPCQTRHEYGTVTENQKRVHLHIIESGTSTTDEYVRLGTCVIDDLPQVLPVNSPIEVTIRYDEQACVHVSARDVTSGRTAHAQIFRRENVVTRPRREAPEVLLVDAGDEAGARASVAGARQHMLQSTFVPPPTGGKEAAASRKTPPAAARPAPAASAAPAPPTPAARPAKSDRQKRLEQADRPLPLCSSCGEALDARGKCPVCQPVTTSTVRRAATPPSRTGGPPAPVQKPTTGRPPASPPPPARALVKEDEAVFDIAIYNVETEPLQSPPPPPSGRRPGPGSPRPRRRPPGGRSNS